MRYSDIKCPQFANCELGLGRGLGLQCEGEQAAGERGGGLSEFVDAMPAWSVAGDDDLRSNQ